MREFISTYSHLVQPLQVVRKMDDYRHSLCTLVQDLPLLWDPTHPDYKNSGKIDGTLPTYCAVENVHDTTWFVYAFVFVFVSGLIEVES